jgi:hypothetical protein
MLLRSTRKITQGLFKLAFGVSVSLTIPLSSAAQETLPKLIKQLQPSVVTILTRNQKGQPIRQGSGFFVNAQGHVITNRHVIEGANQAEVKTVDGLTYHVSSVVAEDDENDLARVSINISPRFVKPVRVSSSVPEVGERIFVIGSPLGLEQTVSEGIISAVRESGNVIQITAPISPGSSGSPVVNMRGEVVGVATLVLLKGQSLNFAVSATKLSKMTPSRGGHISLSEWSRRSTGKVKKGQSTLSVAIPRLKQFDYLTYHSDKLVAEGVRDTILRDLTVSGLVDILRESLYVEDSQASGTARGTFDFKNWSSINAHLLVKGAFYFQGNVMRVELRLYDVLAEREIVGKRYTATGSPGDAERIGHKFADEIIFQITGDRGRFEAEYCSQQLGVMCP